MEKKKERKKGGKRGPRGALSPNSEEQEGKKKGPGPRHPARGKGEKRPIRSRDGVETTPAVPSSGRPFLAAEPRVVADLFLPGEKERGGERGDMPFSSLPCQAGERSPASKRRGPYQVNPPPSPPNAWGKRKIKPFRS